MELVAHNYVQSDLLTNYYFDEEGERELVLETLKVYKDRRRKREVTGWLSPLRGNPSTADVLAEQGLLYTTDYLNDDQPWIYRSRPARLNPVFERGKRLHDLYAARWQQHHRRGRRPVQGTIRYLSRRRRERPA